MTNIFSQEGINFQSSSMASTSPSTNPPPITAPKIDMGNAPANQTNPPVSQADLQPNAPRTQNSGSVPLPPAPDQIAANLAGNSSSEVSATAGAAPPQPSAPQGNGKDIFANEGITEPDGNTQNQNSFSRGVSMGRNQPVSPEAQPVADYASQVEAQTQSLANLRFTPDQIKAYVQSPQSFAEAIANQDQFPDAPNLINKYQSGEPMTDTQNNRLGEYVDATLKTALRGANWNGDKAVIDPKFPNAIVQYIQSVSSGSQPFGASQAPQPYTNGSTVVPPPYTPAVGEKPLNDYSAVTDKGQQLIAQAKDAPASAALKTLSFDQLPVDVQAALHDANIAHNPQAKVSDLATQPGYEKVIDMLGEPTIKGLFKQTVLAGVALGIARNQAIDTAKSALTEQYGPDMSSDDAPWTTLTKSAVNVAGLVTMGIPSAVFGGAAAGVSSLVSSYGGQAAGDRTARDLDALMMSEMGRAVGGHPIEPYLDALTPSKDQAMVNAGVVSIDGAKSNATVAAEGILADKGLPPAQAAETVANMTAREKDNFVSLNIEIPKSPTPTLADTAPSAILAAKKVPQGPNTAMNIIASETNSVNEATPAPIEADQSGFNAKFQAYKDKAYSEMWNDLQPIEDLGAEARAKGAPITDTELSPAALSLAKSTPALVERQLTTGTTTWDQEGNQIVTGKGLKQIRDDFDNMFEKDEPNRDQRQQDLDDFESAMTFTEGKTKDLFPVSDKDFAESGATLSRLSDKYGEKMKWFETFAKEERDWDNRIAYNLVTSGLKTQEWYDDLVGKSEWYSPTSRIVETEYPEDIAKMKSKGLGSDVNPSNIGSLKQRKGSELEVQDKTISRMRNAEAIIKRSMLNKVRGDVAKYSEYYSDKVKVKPPAIIREAVDHSYDPKLRTKLEQLVDFLGGEVKRVAQGEKVGDSKKNLGAYEPATKNIYMRQGSTEGTLTHEAGHMLDYILGLKDRLLNSNEHPEIKAELQKLSEDRLRSEITLERTPEGKTQFAENFERNPKKYVDYVKNDDEVLANFFDAWVNSPEQVERVAPNAKAEFERMIDENPQLSMLREIEPSTQRATETIQKELLDYKGPKDSLPFYDNGRLMFLHLDPEIAKAFKGLDQVQSTMVGGFIAKIGKAQARLLQFGATNNPYFIARHFLRGAQSSFINTPIDGGVKGFYNHFAVEIPKGIAAVIGKNDAYREWASSSGALRTYMDTSDKGLNKIKDEIFNSNDMSKFLDPRKWAQIAKGGWETAKQVSDYAPRIAAYSRLKDAGYSDLEAGFLSLEATGNYTRHGALGKEINAYSPFFNDRLQGADRFLRAVKRDPAGYSMRALALITMPQLLISGYYLFAADDQTRKEYLNLNDFRRSTAMNVKIGNQWIPLPRAFAPGFVFGALPEFALIHFSQIAHPQLKNFWLHMIGDTLNSISPSTDWTQTIPPLLKAAIETKANFSFYRDAPIFHGDINKTAPENQFNSSTSETAKAIGNLFGISPADIDNTAYDMAAHIGVYAEQLGDMAINTARRLSGQPVNERPTRGSDNPLYGPMMQPAPVGTASESFQEFNEHVKDLEQQQNRYNEKTGADAAAFRSQNQSDLRLYPMINDANTQVHNLEHEIRLITENANLSGDDKAAQIAKAQARIQTVIDGANARYQRGKTN